MARQAILYPDEEASWHLIREVSLKLKYTKPIVDQKINKDNTSLEFKEDRRDFKLIKVRLRKVRRLTGCNGILKVNHKCFLLS